MYKVLLVDDEESVLDVLENSIDWQDLGVDELLKAADGNTALELFEQRQIDLLVTDIRMPGLDGIQLIRAVRRLKPETHCVLLTAYSEFEYAKEAIRLGVDNYLLKPVSEGELVQTIRSALDNVYQNRMGSDTILKENILRRWASGTITGEELGERAKVLGLNLYQPAYCAICAVKRGAKSIALFRLACAEALGKLFDVSGFWDGRGRYVFILGGKDFSHEDLAAILTDIAREHQASDTVSLAIGPKVLQAETLSVSYHAASDALDVINYADADLIVSLTDTDSEVVSELLMDDLCKMLYQPSSEMRLSDCKRITSLLSKETSNLQHTYSDLFHACVHVLVREFPLQKGLQDALSRRIELLEAPRTRAEAQRAMMALLAQTRKLFSDCFAMFSPIVQKAVLYIRASVLNGEGASIKEFCAQSGVSSAYLGHLFKQETGVFFNDYLLNCRISKSLNLLMNPNIKIKDVAESVGFTSPSYYVKCFREYKGISPAKYRQDALGGTGKGLVI